jgi:hypothetical protein
MSKKRFAIFLIMSFLFLAGALAAQDAGEYLILNAQYGNEHNHVDVTNRLRELARRDRRFRISDESMAADPDRGHSKMLRVFARGPNGQERFFDFRDGSVFDGAQFRSWRRGDWGDEGWKGGWNGRQGDAGDYVILSAQYGSDRRHVDVTNQLKEMARRDVQFRLDFRTFGVDPDEGHTKSLRIFARGDNGQERMFEYRDNSLIDGAIFRGWRSGEWGGGNWSGNWNGEGEHHENRERGDQGEFRILSAQYGNERHHVDVTNQLKEMARRDMQFRLDFNTFGVDPDEGHSKVLRIFARGPHGHERMFEYRDGSVIDGAQFSGWGHGDWGGDNDHWSGRWEGDAHEEHEHNRQ